MTSPSIFTIHEEWYDSLYYKLSDESQERLQPCDLINQNDWDVETYKLVTDDLISLAKACKGTSDPDYSNFYKHIKEFAFNTYHKSTELPIMSTIARDEYTHLHKRIIKINSDIKLPHLKNPHVISSIHEAEMYMKAILELQMEDGNKPTAKDHPYMLYLGNLSLRVFDRLTQLQ